MMMMIILHTSGLHGEQKIRKTPTLRTEEYRGQKQTVDIRSTREVAFFLKSTT